MVGESKKLSYSVIDPARCVKVIICRMKEAIYELQGVRPEASLMSVTFSDGPILVDAK